MSDVEKHIAYVFERLAAYKPAKKEEKPKTAKKTTTAKKEG